MPALWIDKPLSALTRDQWELLCDGCGKCCQHKLEDEDTGELYFTRVACSLFDDSRCRCTDYVNRKQRVPECLDVAALNAEMFQWLPETCAYRLRSANQPLPAWHPLISEDPESVHRAEMSARGKTVSEDDVDLELLEDYIVHWV